MVTYTCLQAKHSLAKSKINLQKKRKAERCVRGREKGGFDHKTALEASVHTDRSTGGNPEGLFFNWKLRGNFLTFEGWLPNWTQL